MSPKDKAKKLLAKFDGCRGYAVAAVKEIKSSLEVTTGWMELDRNHLHELDKDFNYWKEVRQEIENSELDETISSDNSKVKTNLIEENEKLRSGINEVILNLDKGCNYEAMAKLKFLSKK